MSSPPRVFLHASGEPVSAAPSPGLCERELGSRTADFSRYPFTPLERRRLLVVPLEADVTPAFRRIVGGGRVFRHWKLTVDWRSAVVGPGLSTASDVLDPSVEVTLRQPCPLAHVAAELVDVPASQEE